MSDTSLESTPGWFTIVAAVALIWNLLGVVAYLQDAFMTPEAVAALSQAQQELIASTPAWATAAFAIAVFGGTLGCLALLLKKSWAVPLLGLSLLGVVVQMIHAFFMSNSFEVFGPGSAIMPVMVILVAIFLLWLSMKAKKNGWTD